MNPEEYKQEPIRESLGVRLNNNDYIFKPKNKIEVALQKNTILISLLLIGAVLYGGYKGVKNIGGNNSSSNEMNKDISSLLVDVGKSVALPVGEDPSIFTVADLAPLKNQAFFKDAKIGDKVLVFSKSKKAVLYRPSENRVIVMAPLNN